MGHQKPKPAARQTKDVVSTTDERVDTPGRLVHTPKITTQHDQVESAGRDPLVNDLLNPPEDRTGNAEDLPDQ